MSREAINFVAPMQDGGIGLEAPRLDRRLVSMSVEREGRRLRHLCLFCSGACRMMTIMLTAAHLVGCGGGSEPAMQSGSPNLPGLMGEGAGGSSSNMPGAGGQMSPSDVP